MAPAQTDEQVAWYGVAAHHGNRANRRCPHSFHPILAEAIIQRAAAKGLAVIAYRACSGNSVRRDRDQRIGWDGSVHPYMPATSSGVSTPISDCRRRRIADGVSQLRGGGSAVGPGNVRFIHDA